MQNTGPEAIRDALAALDLDALEAEQKEVLRKGTKTARPRAIRMLNIIQGLRRNEAKPLDLMIRDVPVIPAKYRPFSAAGGTFIAGDANEMYRDLIEYRDLYSKTERDLGRDAAADVYADMVKAVRATYGFGDSPNPKTASRGVKGFFEQITGTNPKRGFVQFKLLSKPTDSVGRATIIPDADLGLDEALIPEDMAWAGYGEHIQRRLVRAGMSPVDAFKQVRERTDRARQARDEEMRERPMVLTRSPAWHSFNITGVYPKAYDGDAIKINTFMTSGHNADFDGDQMNAHVYSTDEAVKDIKDRLMVSKQLWSIKNRDKVVPVPKHEQILGLASANWSGGNKHVFASEEEAMKVIHTLPLGDEIEIKNGQTTTTTPGVH